MTSVAMEKCWPLVILLLASCSDDVRSKPTGPSHALAKPTDVASPALAVSVEFCGAVWPVDTTSLECTGTTKEDCKDAINNIREMSGEFAGVPMRFVITICLLKNTSLVTEVMTPIGTGKKERGALSQRQRTHLIEWSPS